VWYITRKEKIASVTLHTCKDVHAKHESQEKAEYTEKCGITHNCK